jgi:hypothetical protein
MIGASGVDAFGALLLADSALTVYLNGISTVPLVRRHELDTAAAILFIIPNYNRRYPLAGCLDAGEWTVRVVRTVFGCS